MRTTAACSLLLPLFLDAAHAAPATPLLSGAIKRYDWMLGRFDVVHESVSDPDGTKPARGTYGQTRGTAIGTPGPSGQSVTVNYKASGYIFEQPGCASTFKPSKACTEIGQTAQDGHSDFYWDSKRGRYGAVVLALDAPGVQLSTCTGEPEFLNCSSIQSADGQWYEFATKYMQADTGYDALDSVRTAASESGLAASAFVQTSIRHYVKRK